MPYSLGDTASLPKNVRKLSAKKQRQWVHVWNSEYAKHSDEGRAFASANSVVSKGYTGPWASEIGWDWDFDNIDERRVSQEVADYKPDGEKDGMSCANCQWFVGPNSCLLVRGDISPHGRSRFWFKANPDYPKALGAEANSNDYAKAKKKGSGPAREVPTKDTATWGHIEDITGYTVPPMGMNQPKKAKKIKSVVGKIKAAFGAIITAKSGVMSFTRTKEGRLRWFAVVSNNFKDRQGETITEEAHNEFVSWATKTSTYPELWLWHAGPKSRWGAADWLDVCDGFLTASGLVDIGKEFVAYNLSKEDLAVSHGFLSAKSLDGVIKKYRTFEISPLPRKAEANEWTGFDVDLNDENGVGKMPFSKAKRDMLLRAGYGKKQVGAMEIAMGDLSNFLKTHGIEYKDYIPDGGGDVAILDKAMEVVHPHHGVDGHSHTHADGSTHSHEHAHESGVAHHDSAFHHMSHTASILTAANLRPGAGISNKKEAAGTEGAAKSKPAKYKNIPDSMFLDPETWSYPIDTEHIRAAHSYFNQGGQKEAGGYSDAKWAAMGAKLARALGSGYSYKNGKVVMDDEDTQHTTDKKEAKLRKKLKALQKELNIKEASSPSTSGEAKVGKPDGSIGKDKEAFGGKKAPPFGKKKPADGEDGDDKEPDDDKDDTPAKKARKKEIKQLKQAVKSLQGKLTTVAAAQKQDDDTKVENYFKSRVVPTLIVPSQSKDNIVDQLKGKSTEVGDQNNDADWFKKTVLGGINFQGGGGNGRGQ